MSDQVRQIGPYHPITVRLITELEKGKQGDSKTDDELCKIAGMSVAVKDKGYSYLMSAIRYCERLGISWQRQVKQNKILCQTGEEIVERSRADLRVVRKRTRRSLNRISSVDPSSIPENKRADAMALSAQLGAIGLLSRNESTKKLLIINSTAPQLGDAAKLFA
jgi:hypothetical protein